MNKEMKVSESRLTNKQQPIYMNIIKNTLLLFILPLSTFAQNRIHPQWDTESKMHFGFTIGSCFSNFKWDASNEWYHQDSISKIHMSTYPGFCLGAVSDLHIGRRFNLRLIPTLVLAQRSAYYQILKTNSNVKKNVETAMIEAPLLFAFHSDRPANARCYVIGGVKYGYDLAADAGSNRNPYNPQLFLQPSNFSYEFGIGLDRFFEYFKFSPEIKLSKGMNNVLSNYNGDVFNSVFEKFRSNFIFISFYFEG